MGQITRLQGIGPWKMARSWSKVSMGATDKDQWTDEGGLWGIWAVESCVQKPEIKIEPLCGGAAGPWMTFLPGWVSIALSAAPAVVHQPLHRRTARRPP